MIVNVDTQTLKQVVNSINALFTLKGKEMIFKSTL